MPDPIFTRDGVVLVARAELHKRLDAKLVTARPHPTLPLTIWNYTDQCTYAKAWDDYTRICRGLVTTEHDDGAYRVVARGFDKFFNAGESDRRGDGANPPPPVELPTRPPDLILEKLDGSLGICFLWDGQTVWATRGAFGSDQAKAAERIAAQKYPDLAEWLGENESLLVEIIAPETTVVVPYDFEDLVFIGTRETDGEEPAAYVRYSWESETEFWQDMGMRVAKTFNPADVAALQARARTMDAHEEGFVCLWRNADLRRYTRAKVKSAGYASVHRVIGSKSDRAIADRWYANALDFLTILPERLREWADGVIAGLNGAVAELATATADMKVECDMRSDGTRKSFAQNAAALCGTDRTLFGLTMDMYAGKSIDYRLTVYRSRYNGVPRAIEVPAPGEELID